MDFSDERGPYDAESNPLVAFRNHFNLHHSFTSDEFGIRLWN